MYQDEYKYNFLRFIYIIEKLDNLTVIQEKYYYNFYILNIWKVN